MVANLQNKLENNDKDSFFESPLMIELFMQGAMGGDAHYQLLIGKMFCKNLQVMGRDYVQAVKWFKKSAN